jgi:hypothetical protein
MPTKSASQSLWADNLLTQLNLKTMGKNVHVTPRPGGGWQVKGAGNSKATKITDTQKQAINAAIAIAKNNKSEVVIHGPNGRIRDKDSYGNDPEPPKDTKN